MFSMICPGYTWIFVGLNLFLTIHLLFWGYADAPSTIYRSNIQGSHDPTLLLKEDPTIYKIYELYEDPDTTTTATHEDPTTAAEGSKTPNFDEFRKKMDPNHTGYGDGTCEYDMSENLLQVVSAWIDIAESFNITYMLSCGSLLGAWRDENIIPDDHDLDVWVLMDDIARLSLLKHQRNLDTHPVDMSRNDWFLIFNDDWQKPLSEQRRLTCGGAICENWPHCSYDMCTFTGAAARLLHRDLNVWIDIFAVDLDDHLGVLRLFEHKDLRLYDLKNMFPLIDCKFRGFNMKCPKNPEGVLHEHYGLDLSPLQECKNGEWKRW